MLRLFVFAAACLWASVCGAAAGLTGAYYNNVGLSGSPALVRVDGTVNFNWGSGSPDSAVSADNFSVRWTGYLRVQVTGSYTFQTVSDDGVRLSVNGTQLINDWNVHAAITNTSTAISLTAGVDYPVSMEFFDSGGAASVSLAWKKPGDGGYSVVPASNGSLGLSTGATPLLEYRMEESAWSGAIGEVVDSSVYGFNSTAASLASGTPTTASTTPALATNPGTCRYGVFNRSRNDYLAAPTTLPSLEAGRVFTFTAWFRTDDISVGQQYLASDNDNGTGWLLSLGIHGAGTMKFTHYQLPTTAWITTPAVVSNNTWYFVVASMDTLNGAATLQVFNSAGSSVFSGSSSFSPQTLTGDIGKTVLGSNRAGGFGFGGGIDEVRIFPFLLTPADTTALRTTSRPCAATLLAEYKFEQVSWAGTTGEVLDSSGNGYNGTAAGLSTTKPTTANSSPAVSGNPGTCRYGTFTRANKGYVALPASFPNLGSASSFTGTAWIRSTDNTQVGQRIVIDDENGWGSSSVGWIFSLGDRGTGKLNFYDRTNGAGSEVITGSVIANNTWYFTAFGADLVSKTKFIYVWDASGNLLTSVTAPFSSSFTADSGVVSIGGESNAAAGAENTNTYGFSGNIDDVRVYTGALTNTELAAVQALRSTCANMFDHFEIQHASGTGLTCTASTLTVRACLDAACSTLYTGGVSGTFTATGSAMTTNWPTGAGFSIAPGSSSTTEDMQVTTAGGVVLGITGASPAPTNATTCNFGNPSCTFTAADAGLFFDVPNHRAEVSNAVSVTAVKKSDNSATCVPAFASVSKAVNFKCSYANPTTGTQAVRVGGAALNSSNSAASACDATGAAVTLAFNSTGKANTSVIYADAGTMTLTASYSGSGADAGLAMTGTDSFTAAPFFLSVAGPAAGNIAAGSNFAGSVTAKNVIGNPMPNFGKEGPAQSVTLGWVRTQPQGSAAVNGSFTGSLGGFNSGIATSSTLRWSEVGRGELTAVLASGSYLGSGIQVAGASNYTTKCADQLATCTLPAGVTAVVYYGYAGWFNTQSGVTGSIGCNNAVFGDPLIGETRKYCSYFVTSGSSAASAGSIGPFIPHHFDVAATPACSSSFSYAGQTFATTVTARNASNATTLNYDGSANTSPNFAKVTTLADVPALGLGSWSNNSVAVASFAAGVANATPSYAFTTKTTAPQALVVRATDTSAVSSLGHAEPTMPLRSGRLAISNAFGSEKTALLVPVQAQYWSGLTWVQNSADSCTTVPANAVVRAAYADNKGAATAAWTSTASAISINAGAGTLTLGAPSPTVTGSLDFALNLGSTATDQSCLAAHPASTGAGLTWLRSRYGSSNACASAWDRDPSARASFGIYSPETRKIIHSRELF